MITMTRALTLLCLLAASIEEAHGNYWHGHRFQCAQFGLGKDSYRWDLGHRDNARKYPKTGVWTIGTRPMDAEWLGALSSAWLMYQGRNYAESVTSPQDAKCPWTIKPGQFYSTHIEPCVDNSKVRMNLYLVKQGDRILHGWLHVEIELLDQTQGEIELVYIQMRDEKFQAIGEFVNADIVPGAVCKPSNSDLSTPTRYEFFPCGTTGPREAKASQGLMMAKNESYLQRSELERQNRLHGKPIKKGVHFLWRMNEYWCSRHQKIQPVAFILTTKEREKYRRNPVDSQNPGYNGEKLWRKIPYYWIHPKWFGAADVIFKHAEDLPLDCSQLAIEDDTGALTPAATSSWLSASSPVLLKTDNMNPVFHEYFKEDSVGNDKMEVCQINPATAKPTPAFSGRCSNTHEKWSSREYFQECETDTSAPQFAGLNATTFTTYEKFLSEKKEGRDKFCSVKCTVPSTQEEYDAILTHPPINDTLEDVKPNITVGKNDPRTRSKHFKLQAARKYHGMTFSFLAFFVTPVSVFVARNYKETFMRQRCYGVHVWYWTHVGGIVATLSLGSSGHSALSQFYRVWGRAIDDAASLHRTLGYASFGSFFFLVVFGGFRIRAPGCGRLLTITLHSVMGFVHHWLNLGAVIYSTRIPMSPTLKDCDQNGQPEGISAVVWLAVAWIGIDFIFHLILTVLHIHRDRIIGINRSWYCPIVPLADNDQMADMAGSRTRKTFLWIYICVSFSVAVICSILVMRHKLPKHCLFGKSTCEIWAGCTQIALKYAEWYKHQGGSVV